MLELFSFDFLLIAINIIILVLVKKKVKSDKGKSAVLLAASLMIIVSHYSSILYHIIVDGSAMDHVRSNPNLILPIYPCNVVMWCSLIAALIKKDSRVFKFLADFLFLFGSVSSLVGMFANIDFVRDPNLLNYDVTKGIIAHSFMFLFSLLIPTLGYFRFDFKKNLFHVVGSIILMFIDGLYINLIYTVIVSEETAYAVNSMYMIHSPFPDPSLGIIKFPVIAVIAIASYALVLFIIKLFRDKKYKHINTGEVKI